MAFCSIAGCNSDRSQQNISFHRFPQHPTARVKWNEFVELGNQDNTLKRTIRENSKLCSRHFDNCCFVMDGRNKRVKVDHYPHILSFSNENYKCEDLHLNRLVNENQPHLTNCTNMETTKATGGISPVINNSFQRISELDREVQTLKLALESSLQTIKSLRVQLRCIGNQNKYLTRKVVRRKKNKTDHKSQLLTTRTDAEVQTDFDSCDQVIVLPIAKGKQEFNRLVKSLVQRSHLPKYCEFSTFLKEFGMKLHYYSPRAYEFVRKCLNNVLPHPRSYHIWTAWIETKPGFIPASLQHMKRRNEESKDKIFHALSFDEVNIRKQVIFHAGVMKGYIDYGDIYEIPPSQTIATHALFIKVNEINCTNKTVLGYILTNGLTAELMEQVIRRTLLKLHENLVTVITITFDGLPSNFAAAANLGADFDLSSEKFQTHMFHPVTGENVYFIPDPCHMFKLLRNMLDAYGELVDSNEQDIKWTYFGRLMELQRAEGLRAANKVTPRHVNFSKQKMKVKLAVQLFSNSVSVSLRVCEKLDIPGFQGCSGTANFVRLSNRLFDTLNSRPTGERDMEPLSTRNIHSWKPLFKKMKAYLMGLKRKSTGQLGRHRSSKGDSLIVFKIYST